MFKLIKIDNARMNVPEPEYYECGAAITCGHALYMNDGKLYTATKDVAKSFIAMADGKNGETIPVCRISKEQVWETRIEGSERYWAVTKVGSTINVESGGPDYENVNPTSNPDAVVVSKGEADDFYDHGGDIGIVESGGNICIRFLCNFGKNASAGQESA